MKSRLIPIVVMALLGVALGLAGPRLWRGWMKPAGVCPVCLRHEHSDSVVKFRAQGEAPTEACCLSCALSYGRQTGKPVTIVAVTDHLTAKPIDPSTAYFVIGSEVSPCTHAMPMENPAPAVHWDRCLPSILAFSSAEAAEKFSAQYGGRLRRLEELRRELAG